MLNKEKYAKEILDIVCSGNDIGKRNGHLYPCANINCSDCEFNKCDTSVCNEEFTKWANSEYKEQEIDWSKVPVDTPIYVWDSDSNTYKRHFAGYANDKIIAFTDGATSWSNDGYKTEWNHAQIKEGVDCSEWYKD